MRGRFAELARPDPMFPYTEIEIPYRDIASVEKRGEVYRYYLLPVLVEAASFVRRDGRRCTLGYIRANATDHSLPYHEIADEIGRRAGVGVNHKGFVQGGTRFRAIMQDEPPWDAPQIGPEEVEKLRASESRAWKIALASLALLIVSGIRLPERAPHQRAIRPARRAVSHSPVPAFA